MSKSNNKGFIHHHFSILNQKNLDNLKVTAKEPVDINIKKSGAGFTLIELIVVVAIMVVLSGVMIINLTGQRAARDVKIAQNELVSNIRKIQSYTLSSRDTPSGKNVQFYLMKFDLTKPNQYTIQAMYDVSTSPQYMEEVETIKLPINVRLAAVNPVIISRPNPPFVTNPTQGSNQTSMNCAFAAFATPFAKVFLNDGCAQNNSTSTKPYIIAATDDYAKILPSIFVANTDCSGIYGSPFGCTVSVNSSMVITLTDLAGSITKTVTINGITGGVSFN